MGLVIFFSRVISLENRFAFDSFQGQQFHVFPRPALYFGSVDVLFHFASSRPREFLIIFSEFNTKLFERSNRKLMILVV